MQSFKIIAVICALTTVTGCAIRRYRAAPLSPAQTAASLRSRSLADPGLRVFIAKLQLAPATWPLGEWNLADLTLAAFYYNPALAIARGRLSDEAAIVTAGARLNPSVKADLGGETAPESPWIAGFGFSLPIEIAGKRRYRISQAERLADVARWDLTSTAWKVRAQVRSALVEYLTAERNLSLLEDEEHLVAEQVALLEQRFAVGMIPRPELDTARIQHTQTLLAVRAAEGRISQAEASLAAAIGVPTAALEGVKVVWPSFDQPPSAASLNRFRMAMIGEALCHPRQQTNLTVSFAQQQCSPSVLICRSSKLGTTWREKCGANPNCVWLHCVIERAVFPGTLTYVDNAVMPEKSVFFYC